MPADLHFPGTKFVPCSGGCGWHVPLMADDERTTVLCHDCNPETRGKPIFLHQRDCKCVGPGPCPDSLALIAEVKADVRRLLGSGRTHGEIAALAGCSERRVGQLAREWGTS